MSDREPGAGRIGLLAEGTRFGEWTAPTQKKVRETQTTDRFSFLYP